MICRDGRPEGGRGLEARIADRDLRAGGPNWKRRGSRREEKNKGIEQLGGKEVKGVFVACACMCTEKRERERRKAGEGPGGGRREGGREREERRGEERRGDEGDEGGFGRFVTIWDGMGWDWDGTRMWDGKGED